MEIVAGLIATIAVIGLGYATRQGRSLSFYGSVLFDDFQTVNIGRIQHPVPDYRVSKTETLYLTIGV